MMQTFLFVEMYLIISLAKVNISIFLPFVKGRKMQSKFKKQIITKIVIPLDSAFSERERKTYVNVNTVHSQNEAANIFLINLSFNFELFLYKPK